MIVSNTTGTPDLSVRPQVRGFGFAFLLPLITGAVTGLFAPSSSPISPPPPPPPPWYKTTNGYIAIGVGVVALGGISWIAFGGKKRSAPVAGYSRRKRRNRRR